MYHLSKAALWQFAFEWPQVFLTEQTLEGLPHLPGLENGPGFDSQGSVNFFTKYCFPNLHRIHVKAFEVEDCEFVPVHHQPCDTPNMRTNSEVLAPGAYFNIC